VYKKSGSPQVALAVLPCRGAAGRLVDQLRKLRKLPEAIGARSSETSQTPIAQIFRTSEISETSKPCANPLTQPLPLAGERSMKEREATAR
jgi:hypothetical protein